MRWQRGRSCRSCSWHSTRCARPSLHRLLSPVAHTHTHTGGAGAGGRLQPEQHQAARAAGPRRGCGPGAARAGLHPCPRGRARLHGAAGRCRKGQVSLNDCVCGVECLAVLGVVPRARSRAGTGADEHARADLVQICAGGHQSWRAGRRQGCRCAGEEAGRALRPLQLAQGVTLWWWSQGCARLECVHMAVSPAAACRTW